MAISHPSPSPRQRPAHRAVAALVAGIAAFVSVAASCGGRNDATLTGLCEGHAATQRVAATVDTVLPYAGAGLAALKGTRFTLGLAFSPPPPTGPAAGTAECQGAIGEARFSGDLPAPLRTAAAENGIAGWRIEGDTILVGLNPRARDNNLVMSLPLKGGRGHWSLSTFAGEVARGNATAGR
ncbi:MAG: hypothetical protein HOQ09_03755 [Gemmatimonadaceae bacterium]|nr:hypothetical protein [Gemmatimonadaceae bacterium]